MSADKAMALSMKHPHSEQILVGIHDLGNHCYDADMNSQRTFRLRCDVRRMIHGANSIGQYQDNKISVYYSSYPDLKIGRAE